jgi:hypothetical protein
VTLRPSPGLLETHRIPHPFRVPNRPAHVTGDEIIAAMQCAHPGKLALVTPVINLFGNRGPVQYGIS